MKFNLAEVKQVQFEDRLKAFLMTRMFEKSSYANQFRLTWGAKSEIDARVRGFSEGTLQLILRSDISDLIKIVIKMNRPQDIIYLAENGICIESLSYASEESINLVIPILMNRTEKLPSFVIDRLIKNETYLDALYMKIKDTHKEVLPEIVENEKCSPELFVEIVNKKIKDPEVILGYRMGDRLEKLLSEGKIEVVMRRNQGLVIEEATDDGERNKGTVQQPNA